VTRTGTIPKVSAPTAPRADDTAPAQPRAVLTIILLCAVIGAKKLGATRIIALSRNPARQVAAKEFGATDIVEERGDEAVEAVLRLTDGVGVDAALEHVLAGRIKPGLVFDYSTALDHVAHAYAAMDERRAIKSLLTVSNP
jgi:threonine dehydrogenase-like Zn-dependent dehydrogenase